MKLSEMQIHDQFTNENSIFYDIGAKYGEISIPRALKCKQVIAFEPSVSNYEILVQNSAHLGDKYICANVALSETEFDCITKFKDCERGDTQNISYKRLDNFISNNNLPMPTYIKIDVEGMESIILKTMDFIFKQKIPIYCGVHHNTKTWGKEDYKDNPSFKTPENGGFDFNRLKLYDYTVYTKIHSEHGRNTILIDPAQDYNPPDGSHYGMLFV